MGYSSLAVIAFVYDPIFLVKNHCFHPVTYGGDMIDFVTESTRVVSSYCSSIYVNKGNVDETKISIDIYWQTRNTKSDTIKTIRPLAFFSKTVPE